MDTLATVTEDVVHDSGAMTGIKALRSYDRTPMDNPEGVDDERPSRKSGARFSREAILALKKWIDQNRDHPYPTDEQKENLAAMTGLNVGQVANWFANYRRRTKQRSRGVSPSVRSPSWSSSSSEGIPIPTTKKGVVFEGKTWGNMNPLDRWRASPPENEPAPITAIVDAIQNTNVSSEESSLSRSSSRRNLASNNNSDSFSHARAPSVSSFETGQSESKLSSGSYSNLSLTSSRSYNSRGSGVHKDRRRRRKPSTNNALIHLNRPFQCTFCTDTFKTKFDWTRHEKSLHLSLEKWICAPLGGAITCSSSGLKQCVYCGERDPTEDHLDTHNHNACYDKDISSKTFYRKDHLRQHLRLVHGCSQMIDSMESWKSEATYIKSRCGFCSEYFSTWTERVDHLAKHFRAGSRMKEWKGCRGFEDDVSRLVTNAMPPFLIGTEAQSMQPFSAANEATLGLKTALGLGEMVDAAITCGMSMPPQVDLSTWSQNMECFGSTLPGYNGSEAMVMLNPASSYATYSPLTGIIGSTQQDRMKINPLTTPRISTCWEILTLRLGKFAKDKMNQGIPVTDEMLQNAARWILYDSDDPWNQTAADNPEWLELFKKAHGMPSLSTDENIDWMEDLGVTGAYTVHDLGVSPDYHNTQADIGDLSNGIDDLNFDTMLEDSSWDAVGPNTFASSMFMPNMACTSLTNLF